MTLVLVKRERDRQRVVESVHRLQSNASERERERERQRERETCLCLPVTLSSRVNLVLSRVILGTHLERRTFAYQ